MTQENQIRLAVFLLMAVSFTISGYFRRKADLNDQKTTFQEENQLLLKMRNIGALVMYGSILLYFIHPPLVAWGQIKTFPITVRWGAISVLILLIPTFYWMFSSLANNISPTVAIRSDRGAVAEGEVDQRPGNGEAGGGEDRAGEPAEAGGGVGVRIRVGVGVAAAVVVVVVVVVIIVARAAVLGRARAFAPHPG